MEDTTTDSTSHLLDGIDPDNPKIFLSLEARHRPVHIGGQWFMPSSIMRLLARCVDIEMNEGREATLGDFDQEDAHVWQSLAKWTPDPVKYGQLSVFAVDIARKMVMV